MSIIINWGRRRRVLGSALGIEALFEPPAVAPPVLLLVLTPLDLFFGSCLLLVRDPLARRGSGAAAAIFGRSLW